ncbi:MAG TPA: hypothetical protein VHO70_11530 [Chitinispirillaceae bacterium]|nr:hypothetical protein [Chitinispirillaceae bacterium]
MIWTILLILFITVLSLILIAGALILFPTVTFGIYAVLRPDNKRVQIEGSWFHPRIVKFTVNVFNQEFTLTFLGHRLFGSKAGSKPQAGKSEKVPESEETTSAKPGKTVEEGVFEAGSGASEKEFRHASDVPSPVHDSTAAMKKNSADTINKKTHTGERRDKNKNQSERAENKNQDDREPEVKPVKASFFSRLKKNRYFFIIRQRNLQKKLFRWIYRIFKSLFRIIRFHHFDASVKAGIEEPALLGNIYAFYMMTRYTVNVSGGEPIIKFEPVFMKNWFEGEGRFSLQTSVISLIWPAFIAVTSFPYITVLWLFWKSRKLKIKKIKKIRKNVCI